MHPGSHSAATRVLPVSGRPAIRGLIALGWGILAAVVLAQASGYSVAAVSDNGNTDVGVGVDAAIAVAPTLKKGELLTTMPVITRPGQTKTGTSDGWKVTTSWANGYSMWISASTYPALRGNNAAGDPAAGSFLDHDTSGCPCSWRTTGANRGVFGYSVRGDAGFVDPGTWGSSGNRKWRGFARTPYKVAQSNAAGSWAFSLTFRSELPNGRIQPAGDYRADLLLSFMPRT